jgi:uncharacterized membrane protein
MVMMVMMVMVMVMVMMMMMMMMTHFHASVSCCHIDQRLHNTHRRADAVYCQNNSKRLETVASHMTHRL